MESKRDSQTLTLIGLRISVKLCGKFMAKLKPSGYLLNIKRVKPIVDDPKGAVTDEEKDIKASHRSKRANAKTKLVLLAPKVSSEDLQELPADLRKFCLSDSLEIVKYKLVLDPFKHKSLIEILRDVLPKDVPASSSFETIGHVVHINLLDSQQPYRKKIGEIVLKKLKANHIRSVVVKTDKITDKFRVFPMEVVAGDKNLVTEVKEHGCTFKLDYGKVYWNSRLQTEHWRIVKTLQKEDIICDMFCGIGPFAVPAGKRGCKVYANDLNPESYRWLEENVQLNKVDKQVSCFNLDAREFVRNLTKDLIDSKKQLFTVVTMNLPATAIEFLDVFRDLYPPNTSEASMPVIHCYCFSKGESFDEMSRKAMNRIEKVLDFKISNPSIHNVRNVSPKKDMLCISFKLPYRLAVQTSNDVSVPVGSKRPLESLNDSSTQNSEAKRHKSED